MGDGTIIAFANASDVYVADATGANRVRLTNNTLVDRAPAWQPSPV